jgi:hypothetical protein
LGLIADYFAGRFIAMPFAVFVLDFDWQALHFVISHFFKKATEDSATLRTVNIDREKSIPVILCKPRNSIPESRNKCADLLANYVYFISWVTVVDNKQTVKTDSIQTTMPLG